MRNLEKDCRDLERHSNEAILKCNKSKLMMEHKDNTIIQLKSKIEELSLQVINLTCKLTASVYYLITFIYKLINLIIFYAVCYIKIQ